MSLRHFQRRFYMNIDSLKNSDLLKRARKTMGMKLYNMAIRIFKQSIESRDISISSGYFKFALIYFLILLLIHLFVVFQ